MAKKTCERYDATGAKNYKERPCCSGWKTGEEKKRTRRNLWSRRENRCNEPRESVGTMLVGSVLMVLVRQRRKI